MLVLLEQLIASVGAREVGKEGTLKYFNFNATFVPEKNF